MKITRDTQIQKSKSIHRCTKILKSSFFRRWGSQYFPPKNGYIFNLRLHITRQQLHSQNLKCAGLLGTRATPRNVLELFRAVPQPFRGLLSQFFEILRKKLKKAEIFAFMQHQKLNFSRKIKGYQFAPKPPKMVEITFQDAFQTHIFSIYLLYSSQKRFQVFWRTLIAVCENFQEKNIMAKFSVSAGV